MVSLSEVNNIPSSNFKSFIRLKFIPWLILIFFVISFTITTAYDLGTIDGRKYATEKVARVRVILNEPLINDIKRTTLSIGVNNNLYVYDGLYLLLHNDKNYFLYAGINEQCEPERVYVIQDDRVHSIEYIATAPIKPNCEP
jgi:hypothetical protein